MCSSNSDDERHRAAHSTSAHGHAHGAAAEKRDSHQRLAKSFSTPVGAPVQVGSASSGGRHNSSYASRERSGSNESRGERGSSRSGEETRRVVDPWATGGERRIPVDRHRRGNSHHPRDSQHRDGGADKSHHPLTNSTGDFSEATTNGPRVADLHRNENEGKSLVSSTNSNERELGEFVFDVPAKLCFRNIFTVELLIYTVYVRLFGVGFG